MNKNKAPTRDVLNPGEYIVGHIENYPVIYVKEKDILFCKNTTIKYPVIKEIFNSSQDRVRIEEKSLTITKEAQFVTLGCLVTDRANCQSILKQTKKIKNE